jgi:sulfate adenylyltransferase
MRRLIPPHGGQLNPRLLAGEKLHETKAAAARMRQVELSPREVADLMMLASGSFSPLDGFMMREEYDRVLNSMHLRPGVAWPIPVTASVTAEEASLLREGETIALVDRANNALMGVMRIADKYEYDKRTEARKIFQTEDENHPGVRLLYMQKDVYIGGPVQVFTEGPYPGLFPEYARPSETREIFSMKGWSRITAFQTRNPMHRSHEYLVKVALEVSDGVLIHPVVGPLKQDDIPAQVRMNCYRALIDEYFVTDRVLLKVYPMAMRYAGPREAVLHAIIRQNFGCTHLLVGRDHAGVGDYYGPFDAHHIFDRFDRESLQITPLKMDAAFWCQRCEAIASPRTCPHSDLQRRSISGTLLRNMIARGERPPSYFSRPEVVDILSEYYTNRET